MKFVLLKLVRAYQALTRSGVVTPLFFGGYSGCRSWPTCSDFAYNAIATQGVVVGGLQSIQKVLRCQRFHSAPSLHQ